MCFKSIFGLYGAIQMLLLLLLLRKGVELVKRVFVVDRTKVIQVCASSVTVYLKQIELPTVKTGKACAPPSL